MHPDKAQRDTAVPDQVEDKAAPVAQADAVDAADAAPTILAQHAPVAEEEAAEQPASPATTRMAFTPRPWTTVIALR